MPSIVNQENAVFKGQLLLISMLILLGFLIYLYKVSDAYNNKYFPRELIGSIVGSMIGSSIIMLIYDPERIEILLKSKGS